MGRIFIAAGHHPSAPGACFDGVCEHDIATKWVDSIAGLLGEFAVLVPSQPLKQKAAFVNARCKKGDVAVEIHFNSAVNSQNEHIGRGSCSLYYPGSEAGRALAERCQEVLSAHYPPDRGEVEGWYRGDKSKGAYYFLEKTKCPAVILEPQFIHLRDDIYEHQVSCCEKLADMLLSAYVFEVSEES